MTTRKYRVSADLPEEVRRLILSRHRPAHDEEHLRSLTWAYGVPESVDFDGGQQVCTLYALHTGLDTQAFLADLGGQRLRPDGRLLHLTFSTVRGVPPAAAGQIDAERVETIRPVSFPTQLVLRPLWAHPSRRAAASA